MGRGALSHDPEWRVGLLDDAHSRMEEREFWLLFLLSPGLLPVLVHWISEAAKLIWLARV